MTGDPFDESFLDRIMQIESGGNPNARTGSYKGLFQLSDQEFNRYGGGNIYDPMDNRNAAIRKLEAERERFREKYNEEPSPTDLYMMHQQGEAGYAAHRANPDAPAWQNMASTGEGRQKGANWARQAIWGNVPDKLKRQFGSVDNISSADFVGLWRNKVEGGAMPSNYDTEDRTAVGLGGSRAYAPEEEAVADATGQPRRRQMADQPRGIMDFLTGGQQQQQQPGGLLGMLGDPETMAYLAMIAKGASPYSSLDPNSMLTNAHNVAMKKAALQQQQAEQARDNARADRALGLREQEYGLARTDRQARDAALFEERQQKRDLAAKQKEIDDEVRKNLGGGGKMPGAPDDATAATTVPEGTRSPEDQIAQYQAELAKNPSPALAKSIERKIEQLQKGPPASTLNLITKAENEIAPLQATKDKLERMQTLLPNILEGPLSGIAGTVSQYGPAAWRNPKATDTLEFNNLAQIETIRDMSRTMKGSTAVREMDVWLTKAADPKLPKEIRQSNLKLATDAVNREIAIRENRVKELREGTYGRKQTPRTDDGGGGGSVGDPLGIR